MADLKITLGADTKEFERSIQQAGKTINYEFNGRGGKGGGGFAGFSAKGYDFAENLMAGRFGTAIGSLFGPLGEAAGSFVDTLIKKSKELMDKAIELRNLSLQTNLTTQQIQGLEAVAKASGVSIGKLADNISEYNRRLGYARMHGGEMNVLLNKMGVSFEQIKNGTFSYFDAIEELRKAQAAGTDEATLNHYAQVMLGSSYKELLPLIKMGSENLKNYSNQIYKVSNESIEALQNAGNYWNIFAQNVENRAMEMLGRILSFNEEDRTAFASVQIRAGLKGREMDKPLSPEEAVKFASDKLGIMDPEKKKRILQNAVVHSGLADDDISGPIGVAMQQSLLSVIDKMYPKGTKLNPFGAELAQGASQMQQMGGGDLFGAVSFNPLQRMADNTDQINTNVAKIANQQTPTTDPQRDGLNR